MYENGIFFIRTVKSSINLGHNKIVDTYTDQINYIFKQKVNFLISDVSETYIYK